MNKPQPPQRSAAQKTLDRWLGRASRFVLKYRYVILSIVGLGMVAMELGEHGVVNLEELWSLTVILNVVSIVIMMLLVELLVQYDRQKSNSVKILKRKHLLARQLSLCEDWETLIQSITEIPAALAEVDQSALLVSTSQSRFEIVARWSDEGRVKTGEFGLMEGACGQDPETHPQNLHVFEQRAAGGPPGGDPATPAAYCLPIPYGRTVLGLLRFRLKPGERLHPRQAEVLAALVDDISVALKTGIHSRNLAELNIAEAAVRERRRLTRDLHDHLGQNLSYLRLKLDQFASPEVAPTPEETAVELGKMQSVAEESYRIVRNMLETMQAPSGHDLGALLRKHGQEIGQRANFKFDLATDGEPQTLPPATQQNLFYIFREALNNVEKHARATQVEARLVWTARRLTLIVADNGCGLSQPLAPKPDRQLGLGIIQERAAELNGQVQLSSAANRGTTVSVFIPLSPMAGANGQA